MMFDISDQLYHYISHFFITQDNVSASFILSLFFLIKMNLNHDYNIEKFLWRNMRHITAHWVFTVSEKKVLKSVLHMNNLTITEHFIKLFNFDSWHRRIYHAHELIVIQQQVQQCLQHFTFWISWICRHI